MNRRNNLKKKKKINKQKKTIKRLRKLVTRRQPFRPRRSRMPMAQTRGFRKALTQRMTGKNSMIVSGQDLLTEIPYELTQLNTNVMAVVPCNPAYWTGTRISTLAVGYQNYRPLSIRITYIPQCAATQQGNVIGGTLWNQVPDEDNLQKALRTSNGGFITQVFKSHTTVVKLQANLPLNLFRMGGALDNTSNPFYFVAMSIGATNQQGQVIVPGYFYISYKFELKNPIGNSITYFNLGLKDIMQLNTYDNLTGVLVSRKQKTGVDIFTEVQLDYNVEAEQEEQQYIVKYNGMTLDIPDDTLLYAFGNKKVDPHNMQKTPQIEDIECQTYTAEIIKADPNAPNWALVPIQAKSLNIITSIQSGTPPKYSFVDNPTEQKLYLRYDAVNGNYPWNVGDRCYGLPYNAYLPDALIDQEMPPHPSELGYHLNSYYKASDDPINYVANGMRFSIYHDDKYAERYNIIYGHATDKERKKAILKQHKLTIQNSGLFKNQPKSIVTYSDDDEPDISDDEDKKEDIKEEKIKTVSKKKNKKDN